MIDEIWECKFQIRGLVPLKFAGVNSDIISFKNSMEENISFIAGKIKITSKAYSSKNYVLNQAVKDLKFVFGLSMGKLVGNISNIENNIEIYFEIKVLDAILVNKNELKRIGQRYSTSQNFRYAVHASVRMLKDPQNISYLLSLWNNNQEKFPQEFKKSIDWYIETIDKHNIIDRFIYAWINFEMLYGWKTKATTVDKGFKGLIGNNLPPEQKRKSLVDNSTEIIELLSKKLMPYQDRTNGNEIKDRGKDLQKAFQSQHTDLILEKMIKAISWVRNHIFHGKTEDKTKEVKLISSFIIEFNSKIIEQLLKQIAT